MARDKGKRPERTSYTDQTLTKVYFALAEAGVTGEKAIDAVSAMSRAGILFRERETEIVEKNSMWVGSQALADKIQIERDRQISLGYTPDHDREHGIYHILNVVSIQLQKKQPIGALAALKSAFDSFQ